MTDPQPALFDADTTADKPCPVPHCGALLLPGQQPPIPTCQHDLQPPADRPYRRPKGCLNRHPPNEFPAGY